MISQPLTWRSTEQVVENCNSHVLGTEQIIENYLKFLCNIADIAYLIIFCKVVHCVWIIGQPVSVILVFCMTI